MNLYFELLKMPVFKVKDVNRYYNNIDSARSAIRRLMKYNMVVKIRNDLYTCISGETRKPVANRFQIACNITPTSYISHHTAMEYYGIADQVFCDVYVSSETSFREFEFDGYTYHYISSNGKDGIDKPAFSSGIVVTTLERTLVDSINDMDKISGVEEVIQNITSIESVQEKRILSYLEKMSKQFLYQKTGFLLSKQKEKFGLSDNFFIECQSEIGKSKRYLLRDMSNGVYDNEWKLVVPQQLSMNNIAK